MFITLPRIVTTGSAKMLLLAGLAMTLIGCEENVSSLTIPLTYSPTAPPSTAVAAPAGRVTIYVSPAADDRTDTTKIGENREHDRPIPVMAGTPGPAEFVRTALSDQLSSAGLHIVNSAEGADRIINVSINTFFVDETNQYRGRIICNVEVRDKSGKSLWTGAASGDDSTFGRSLSYENYQQVLSNSMVKLTGQLLATSGFLQALTP